jgi:hypothetical protein
LTDLLRKHKMIQSMNLIEVVSGLGFPELEFGHGLSVRGSVTRV